MFITLSRDRRRMNSESIGGEKTKRKNTKPEEKLTLSSLTFLSFSHLKSPVVVLLLNHFCDTRSFVPVPLPKYIREKMAAVFSLNQNTSKKRFHTNVFICKASFSANTIFKLLCANVLTVETSLSKEAEGKKSPSLTFRLYF